jgi:uncharacterized damage-inducible protein DinB
MATAAAHLAPFIRNWKRIHKQTTRLMRVAPSEKFDWRTCDGAMTLGELMNHLSEAEAGLVRAALEGAFSNERPEPKRSTEELIAAFDASHGELLNRVIALTPEQLEEKIAPFGEKAGEMTRGELLHFLLEHEIHHRGQLYVYLRMLGAPVPPLFGG